MNTGKRKEKDDVLYVSDVYAQYKQGSRTVWWKFLYQILCLRQMRFPDAKSTQYLIIMVIDICKNSTNNDTSQHASANNRIGIQYNNLRPQMGIHPASL
jgi:hypothetical protein